MVTARRLPEWLKVKAPGSKGYLELRQIVRSEGLNTVCEEAHCPNIGECWDRGTATFMVLGDICTRACSYCAVNTGMPTTLDLQEPVRLAETVERLGLAVRGESHPWIGTTCRTEGRSSSRSAYDRYESGCLRARSRC